MWSVLTSISLATLAVAQQIGTTTPEVHPPLAFSTCTTHSGCTTTAGAVVIDAGSRSIHTASGQTCNPNGGFDRTICPDAATCAKNCALEGVDYSGSFGVTTSGNAVSLVFGKSGSRVYLLDSTGNYKNFHVMNQEFAFDVDVSKLPCGFNGALYFSEMPPDGGLSSINKAGAAYGTGYCDSQCPKGLGFINGTINVDGSLGSCCNEMDLWEANSESTALTPHPCNVTGEFLCTGSACSNLCDPNGCDFNPFRMGNHTLYGPGAIIDTKQKLTVITQFITDDNTATGTLVKINRLYIQNGRIISNSNVNIPNMAAQNAITPTFCTSKEQVLGDATYFDKYGGLAQMGQSLARGAVLVMSLWDDLGGGMTWLDGTVGSNPSAPGAQRGPCTGSVSANPSAAVIFSNIKVGDINSTITVPGPPPPPPPFSSISSSLVPPSSVASSSVPSSSVPLPTTTSPAQPTQTHYGQCGGTGWAGPTVCASPYTCKVSNAYYSQCL